MAAVILSKFCHIKRIGLQEPDLDPLPLDFGAFDDFEPPDLDRVIQIIFKDGVT